MFPHRCTTSQTLSTDQSTCLVTQRLKTFPMSLTYVSQRYIYIWPCLSTLVLSTSGVTRSTAGPALPSQSRDGRVGGDGGRESPEAHKKHILWLSTVATYIHSHHCTPPPSSVTAKKYHGSGAAYTEQWLIHTNTTHYQTSLQYIVNQ